VGVLRFPHAWDDPRLGACAHERAVTYLQMPRLQWPLASLTSRAAPPLRGPLGDPQRKEGMRRARHSYRQVPNGSPWGNYLDS
jgi:hypothetical protein